MRKALWIVGIGIAIAAAIVLWKQYGGDLPLQLRAGGPVRNDPKCEAGWETYVAGTVTYRANNTNYPLSKKTLADAQKYLLDLATADAKGRNFDCRVDHLLKTPPQWRYQNRVIGTIQLAGDIPSPKTLDQANIQENIKDIKKYIYCDRKLDKNEDPLCETSCEQEPDVTCANVTRGASGKKGAPAADCEVTEDPRQRPPKGPFFGGAVTCKIRYQITAVCTCRKETSTPVPSNTPAPVSGTPRL